MLPTPPLDTWTHGCGWPGQAVPSLRGPVGTCRTAPPPLRSLQVWAWSHRQVDQELQCPESCRPTLGTQAEGMVQS